MRLKGHTLPNIPKASDQDEILEADFPRHRRHAPELLNVEQPEKIVGEISTPLNTLDIDYSIQPRSGTGVWHRWTVIIPRRSITGGFVWGTVWRRTNRQRWLYKKFDYTKAPSLAPTDGQGNTTAGP
jgi:hypothetical protein